ncbi:cytochrome c family protein [Marivita sp. S6314]|uniref:c-type cytochrome n=1 Tax=Marivita sp. S6314 TaxID=2926406 RepID=UPI001FF20BAB|nr:cytochrome c family protein [Marivita sp. S6314]MCK0150472.1 cytochrome c family protein [Marivita sp. S6314]
MLKKLSLGLLALTIAAPVFAEGDAAKGEKVFRKCKACHAVGDGAKNKVGPALNGIVGAAAGANPDFKYSDGLLAKAAEGLVWDEAALTAYMTKPGDFIEGTKMSFAGLRKDDDITNVIAYLATFN